MLERTTISQPDRPPGILEHLSEGMSLVLAFPQLIAIPVLLDIYLLIGARISPGSMTTRLGDWLVGRNGANSVDAGEWVRGLGDWDMSRLLAFLMPSVMDGMKQDAIYRPFDRMAWSPSIADTRSLPAWDCSWSARSSSPCTWSCWPRKQT